MSDVAADIARHKAVLASGHHLLSGFATTDVEVAGADLAVELPITEYLTGPRRALHGGLVATLADLVGGRIAMMGLDQQSIVVTSDMTLHYLGPVTTTAHVVGHVLRRGTRAVVVRVEVYDERDGPLAAACQLAFTVVTPRPA
ncbi:MAG: PaaI family thioesterase [Acidimicrobiia bacterium]|nr:PaaI family thioesterase [Acidimicrobiia bacterium]